MPYENMSDLLIAAVITLILPVTYYMIANAIKKELSTAIPSNKNTKHIDSTVNMWMNTRIK